MACLLETEHGFQTYRYYGRLQIDPTNLFPIHTPSLLHLLRPSRFLLRTLPLTSQQTPTIQRNRRPIHKRAPLTTQPQTRPRDILGLSNPLQRNTPLNAIPKLLQRRLHHLALKRSTRNRIARDVASAEMQS